MAEIDLKAIRERLNAATPGKWETDLEPDDDGFLSVYAPGLHLFYTPGHSNKDVKEKLADCVFVANAKQDIAALIEAVEERGRIIEAYEQGPVYDRNGLIRYAREDKGVSLRKEAAALGISSTFLSMMERGILPVPPKRIQQFKDFYGIILSAKDKGEENG